MAIDSLNKLFVYGLPAIYDAEQQNIEVAPSIAESVTSPELKQVLAQYLESSQAAIPRLEEALKQAGAPTERFPNEIAQAILSFGKQMQNETSDPNARDAGIIASTQVLTHYFVAAYGAMRAYAETLGLPEAAEMFAQLLQQRKQQDEQMTELAEQTINRKAKSSGK